MGKIAVNIRSFGEWYQKLLDEVKEMQVDLFGGISFEDEEWLSVKVPEVLVDEVNTSSPGFCFGDLERNDMMKYEDAALNTLFHHPCLKGRFGAMLSGGNFILNAVGCHDFLRRSSLVRSKMATLLHISGGGPARGTEFTSSYLRNHPQGDIRNVKVIDDELCLVGGYNKTSGIVSSFSKVPPQFPMINLLFSRSLDREEKQNLSIHSKESLPPLHCRLVRCSASGNHSRRSSRPGVCSGGTTVPPFSWSVPPVFFRRVFKMPQAGFPSPHWSRYRTCRFSRSSRQYCRSTQGP